MPETKEPEEEAFPTKTPGTLELATICGVKTEYWRSEHVDPFHYTTEPLKHMYDVCVSLLNNIQEQRLAIDALIATVVVSRHNRFYDYMYTLRAPGARKHEHVSFTNELPEATYYVCEYLSRRYNSVYVVAIDLPAREIETWTKQHSKLTRSSTVTLIDLSYIDNIHTGAEARIISQTAQRHGAAQFHVITEVRIMPGISNVENLSNGTRVEKKLWESICKLAGTMKNEALNMELDTSRLLEK